MDAIHTNKKILVVEDELPLRQALVDVLEFAQFAVMSAHNGEEGLALALKEEPDVILLDIVMPVMDGFSMLKKLRTSGEYGAKVPVIVLSNLSLYNEDLEGDFHTTHPESYLLKTSWAIEDVVKKVESVLAPAPL